MCYSVDKIILDALNELDIALHRERIQNPVGYLNGVLRRMNDSAEYTPHGGPVATGETEPPMGERISNRVIQKLRFLSEDGVCAPEEIDGRCREMLQQLTERGALAAMEEIQRVDRSKILNFGNFFLGVLKKYRWNVFQPPPLTTAGLAPVPADLDTSQLVPPAAMPVDLLYGYAEDEYIPQMPRVRKLFLRGYVSTAC